MKPKERVLNTINFKPVDRIPVYDIIQNIQLIEYCTGEKVTLQNGYDLLCRVIRDNLDVTRGVCPPLEEKIYMQDDGFVYKQEWWTTWLIDRPFKDVEGLREFILRNIEEINNYKCGDMWTFTGRNNFPEQYNIQPGDLLRKTQERIEDTVLFNFESPVGLDTAFTRAGIDLFIYGYNEYPELISEWLEALNEAEIKRVHDFADSSLSPLAFVHADIAFKNTLLFSPAFLRKEFFPRLEKLVYAWHQHGMKVVFHSDGYLMEILPDLVMAGIDCINPIETIAGMDVSRIREQYPALTMMGCIDCSNLLPYGTTDEVDEAVAKAVKDGWRNGGLILGSSSEIHPGCKLENIVQMWKSAKKYK